MATVQAEHLPWQLADTQARLQRPRVQLSLDLARPSAGLHDTRCDGVKQIASLLAVPDPTRTDAASFEHYLRGHDVVGIYPPTAQNPFRHTLYWRSLGEEVPASLAAIELVISAQTELLDSNPLLQVTSSVTADETWQLVDSASGRFEPIRGTQSTMPSSANAIGAFLFRLPGGKGSYLELVHPLDYHEAEIMSDGGGRFATSHPLFLHRLEKGVILRSRLRAVWLDRADDLAQATHHAAAFAASELPLTT